MGTKGFVILSCDLNERTAPILAVTSDGFDSNLVALSRELMLTAHKMRVLMKFRNGDRETVKQVMQRVCENNNDWPFLDIYHNAIWVSYSVVLDPKEGTVRRYEGNLEYRITESDSVISQKIAV
jgi:hypothetical protein